MYVVFIVLILLYFNIQIDSHELEVVNSGVLPISKDDIIVGFFVTLKHHGEKSRIVMTTMVECCEKITDEDIDCEVIHLQGEHLGVLQPSMKVNATFLYPNFYGYNRKGSCVVDIWNRVEGESVDDIDQIRHRIDFDLSIRVYPQKIPVFFQALYNPEKIVPCETTDLDPFDACNPVNCRLKYSGLRNYFNHKRKRCQKVPTCLGDPNKELPDIVYNPLSNTCRDLEKAISPKDIIDLLKNNYDSSDKADLQSKMVNIQCHHGEIDVRSGLCVCDQGWTSEYFDSEEYDQGQSVYHMCDKKCHPDTPRRSHIVPFLIGISLALWILLLIVLFENCNYFCQFYKRRDEAEDEEICYFPVGEAPDS